MGVFSDNLRKYYELGLYTVPIGDGKNPLTKGFDEWCENGFDDSQVDYLENQYSFINRIGLLLGKASGIIAFDFDYEFKPGKMSIDEKRYEKDYYEVENEIIKMLPQTPCIKTGRKGWTRFYKWSEEWGESSNYQADRNGTRLFDMLAWHKQTVIPPSFHSVNENGHHIYYKWLNLPITDCLDDLPTLDRILVETIKYKFETKKGKRLERHDKLFDFIVLNLRLGLSKEEVAKKVVKHDLKVNEGNPYLTDKKYNSRGISAEEFALKWIDRCTRYADGTNADIASPNINEKKLINNREYFFELFPVILGEHRLELFSKKLMIAENVKLPNGESIKKWRPALNEIGRIRSDCFNAGFNRTHAEDNLMAYIKTLTPELLIDIPEWDGVDRLDKILRLAPARNINVYGDYEKNHAIYVDIIKDLSAGIFRRVFNPLEQNLSPIIRGGQGIGKNTLIQKVWGEPFDYYYAEINVNPDPQKNYDAVDGRIVCVIGEFDQTSKVAISFLKELITNASATYRKAYARDADRHEFHHTIFGASNFLNVLKDTTGNRRFVIFDLDYINYEYVEHCDKNQLLAQFYKLYLDNYRMSDESKAWIKAFNEGETPENPLDIAVEVYSKRIKDLNSSDRLLSNDRVAPVISDVCKIVQVSDVRLRQELKRRKLSKRDEKGMKYVNLNFLDNPT